MRILAVATIVCLAVLASGARTALGQELNLNISHQWPERTDGRDRAVRVFVQEVEARTKGLKLQVHAKSSLGIAPAQVLAALRDGKLEMAVYPLVYAAPQVPELALAGLPGLVPNLDTAQILKGSDMHEALQALAEARGFRILTWWWAPGGFFTKDLQIFGPASVNGLTMQVADPLFETMLKAAGASVVSMPEADIPGAMKSGDLDAIATTYEAFMSLRLFEQAKLATLGTSLFMEFCPIVVSLGAWNRLTPEQRSAIEEAAALADTYFDTVERDLTRRMESALRSNGVAIWRMSPDDYLAWLGLAQQTAWSAYAKTNPAAQGLLLGTLRTVLSRLGDKGTLPDSPSDDKK